MVLKVEAAPPRDAILLEGSGIWSTLTDEHGNLPLWIEVEQMGAGGSGSPSGGTGAQGSATPNGTLGGDGGSTVFGTVTVTGGKKGPCPSAGNGAAGGDGGDISGTPDPDIIKDLITRKGARGGDAPSTYFNYQKPGDGGGPYGGKGCVTRDGGAAVENSGCGGAGGGDDGSYVNGTGGGQGGYAKYRMWRPGASFNFEVGEGGVVGVKGTAGRNPSKGARGFIKITVGFQ